MCNLATVPAADAGSIIKKTPEAADPELVTKSDANIEFGVRMCDMAKTILTKVGSISHHIYFYEKSSLCL